MENPFIALNDIQKEYRNGDVTTTVLRGVTFAIAAGEFVALMGPSGSGKSTLMHLLGFLDRPTSGTYFFKGTDTTHLTDTELAHMRSQEVGFIFQAFHLLPKSTVLENVMLPMLYAGIPVSERKGRAERALESVGLSHRLSHLPNQLSGGERQRTAIARSLVNEPHVIFADEPTGNLDTKSGEAVLSILQELHEKKHVTIIMVTHELEAAQHAERIIRVRDGLIVGDEQVIDRRRGEYHK